ncbi:MAG TPA: hypothetical protein VFL66_05490 [Gaiellaceae bacterium]|nr:hypothetical protein [Gaiellaceae bacterium]
MSSGLRRPLALAAAAVAAAAAAGGAGGSSWTSSVYVSPHGSDAGPCTRARPCRSFDRAYRAASPGQTILLAGGTYPSQLIRVDPRKVHAHRNVVFRPAPGATVTIAGDLAMYGSHATFLGARAPWSFRLRKLSSVATRGPLTSNHVAFVNLKGETFSIGPNYDIAVRGGDFGPSVACYARGSATNPAAWCPRGSPYARTGNGGSGGSYENEIGPDGTIRGQWPHDILIDGVTIHDQNSLDLGHLHQGGLFLISGYRITIRDSKFLRNVVYQLQVQDFTSRVCCGMRFGPPHDVVIENNWFGPPVTGLNDPGGDRTNDNQPELQLDPRGGACWRDWLIRFNSFHNGLALGFDHAPCFADFRVIGNIGEHPGDQCFYDARGLSWVDNAWVGGRCGPTDVALASLPYVSTTIGAEDYHLTGGPAQDLVTPSGGDYALGTDIDGDRRPRGPARDAGADER